MDALSLNGYTEPINGDHYSSLNNTNGRKVEEISIPVPWGIVAGKWWGPRNKQPVLAIHGWQDNAGTFDRLCPLLDQQIPILAIDLPGHGRSTHYPRGMHYYVFWDGISLIRRIVKHFGWENVSLMGHSLGGCLSFMYAACFPDEVKKFIIIDIYGPTVRNSKKTAAGTGDAIDKFLQYETLPESKQPCYNYEDMIDVVLGAYGGACDLDAVEVLMKRGMTLAEGKEDEYKFTRDIRLKVALMGMFSYDQLMSYTERIKCEVLNIRALPGMKFDHPEIYGQVIEALRKTCKKVVYEEVPGTHHLHLVTPERISKIVNDFLLDENN